MPTKPATHKPPMAAAPAHQAKADTWGQGRGGSKWRAIRKRIFERDKYLCQIHLKRGQLVSVRLHGQDHGVCDHIKPKAEGGTDADSNLQTICQACDRAKTQAESKRAQAGGG